MFQVSSTERQTQFKHNQQDSFECCDHLVFVYIHSTSMIQFCPMRFTHFHQWIIQIYRLFDALIFVENGTTPAQVYGASGNPKNIASMTLFSVQTLVSDMIMVRRLRV
ncbi:hypothetical protein PTI98_012577 [Pleurotus ostreatus]|nr:hypothetical protein PTI98_012577 [Pleurotus ostreatus]